MTLGWFARRINDYTMTPYKKVLWLGKQDKVVLKNFFKINEPIKNTLGYFFEGMPTYTEKNVEVYVYYVDNALQLRLKKEAENRKKNEEKYKDMEYYRAIVEKVKDISRVMGDKIKYNYTVSATEKQNLNLSIKYISPAEYRAVKELESLVKITKTKKVDNPLFDKNNIVMLIVGAVIVYVVAHYVLHMFISLPLLSLVGGI